jgi:hypothetical protein
MMFVDGFVQPTMAERARFLLLAFAAVGVGVVALVDTRTPARQLWLPLCLLFAGTTVAYAVRKSRSRLMFLVASFVVLAAVRAVVFLVELRLAGVFIWFGWAVTVVAWWVHERQEFRR